MDELREQSDAALMRCAQQGRQDAFAEIAGRYQSALVRVARGRLGREDWAEEAAQETLMAALRSRHTYDASRGFRTWLWTILLNQCTAVRRRQTRAGRVANWTDRATGADDSVPIDHHALDPAASPLAALLTKERAELLDRLLAQLSEPQADALRLRFFATLKFQEIADAVDCSLLTAKNRVKTGLLKLAELLNASSAHDARPNRETTDPCPLPPRLP
ncbi:MAG: RNA polymerase sigma factor [Pirellulales bacterium]